MAEPVLLACAECATPFVPRRRTSRFCSRRCAAASGSRVAASNPSRAKRPPQRANGYVRAWDESRHAYVYEHRLVMEGALGRRLERSEHVHHLNDDRTDNRPENLAVMSASDHARLHGPTNGRRPKPSLRKPQIPCPVCATPFTPYARTPGVNVTACSYACSNRLRPRGVCAD